MEPFVSWRRDTVRAAGATLVRATAGSADPRAQVVLLVHGLGQWSEIAWSRLVARMSPARRYVAIDLPGLGRSEKPDVRYDRAYFAAALADVAQTLGTERYALAGHSLGGFLAAGHAAAHPQAVTHLALIAPAGFARVRRWYAYGLAARWLSAAAQLQPPRAVLAAIARRAVFDPASLQPDEFEMMLAQAADPRVRRTFARLYGAIVPLLNEHTRILEEFARYRGPVCAVWGAHDRFIPRRSIAAVERVYPHAMRVVLARSAHLPMIEEPDTTAAAFETLLATNPPS